jgi:long-chain-fatty-acid---luciferin-component ligase
VIVSPADVSSTAPLREEVADGLSGLDEFLASDGLFALDPATQDDVRATLLTDALEHHRAGNDRFDRYCDRFGAVTPRPPAWESIPLLPVGLFKRDPAVVVTKTNEPYMLTTSSGTQGTVSRVPRDDTTLMRFFASVAAASSDLLGFEHHSVRFFNLGPQEISDLWIAYVMLGVGVFLEGRSYTRDGRFRVDEVLDDLDAADPGAQVAVVGPPPLMLALAEAAEQRGLHLSADPTFVTIGGWKASRRRVSRRELEMRLATGFGLRAQADVRDAFNMVELNTAVLECEKKRKHCPPWLVARARDPRTLAALPSGEVGVLSFADPTPTSYPGFLLTDDLGAVWHAVRCDCGRVGDVLDVHRRVRRVESRGCALKIDQALGGRHS